MLEAIELKPTTSGIAAIGLAAALQGSDETVARTRGQTQNNLKPATEVFSKASNAAVQFGCGNLEAMAQSTQIYLTGMQDLSRQYVTAVQGLMQHAPEGTKTFAGATSLGHPQAGPIDPPRAPGRVGPRAGGKLPDPAPKPARP